MSLLEKAAILSSIGFIGVFTAYQAVKPQRLKESKQAIIDKRNAVF